MKKQNTLHLAIGCLLTSSSSLQTAVKLMKITERGLNLSVSHQVGWAIRRHSCNRVRTLNFDIRLTQGDAQAMRYLRLFLCAPENHEVQVLNEREGDSGDRYEKL